MSMLNYCSENWGLATKSLLARVEKLQNKAFSTLLRSRVGGIRDTTYYQNEMLSFSDIVKLNLMKCVYKATMKNVPSRIDQMFVRNFEHYNYGTRGAINFHVSRNHFKPISNAIVLWNSAPAELKNATSLRQFIRIFKNRLFRS